jgi:hypothetical protein
LPAIGADLAALAKARAGAVASINAGADAIRALFVTDLRGQEMIYLRKEAEARAFVGLGDALRSAEAYPFILAEVGMTSAAFEVNDISVALNGVWVCRDGASGDDRELVDMTGREVVITINLNAGDQSATIWTNDLTAAYVHENSAYAT